MGEKSFRKFEIFGACSSKSLLEYRSKVKRIVDLKGTLADEVLE